ncbi:hypothetical protein ACERK3_07075 [Phycisphaerales bacterium AB-hyl4]|uniref:Glycoside hydrolase 123 C-terminal domain-containing protein n=1 Tax=Natronomicrosphaera hydrolytica TaxID=3242702 RepID=A0ABV4U412_9BACT
MQETELGKILSSFKDVCLMKMCLLKRVAATAVIIPIVFAAGGVQSFAEIIWFDGTRSDAPPRGYLLTDNEDYWGDAILTGVEYAYEAEPGSPPDDRPDRLGRRGRILLNGNRGVDVRPGQNKSVGMNEGDPLVVVFDFKRRCTFAEWNIITPTQRVAISLEMRSSEEEPWEKVFEQSIETSPTALLHRLKLPDEPGGRYVRLTVQSPDTTLLNEVLAWGDAEVSDETPEIYTPAVEHEYPVGIAFETVPGASKSTVSDRESFYWVQSLGSDHRKQDAVWAKVPAWSSISHEPMLPDADRVNQPVHMVMARNETEATALVLRNTLVNNAREVRVRLDPLKTVDGDTAEGIEANLGVFGVIGDPSFGNNLGPIFEEDNLLGGSLMRKYLLNGAHISNFPHVTLSPSGGAVFWLSVTTDGVEPGIYKTHLYVEGNERVPVNVEVLDVTLPMPFAHVKTYSYNRTTMFPFEYADRLERDIAYALDSGISDWSDVEYIDLIREMASDRGMRLMFDLGMLIPWTPDYVGMIYQSRWTQESDFPDDARERIAEAVEERVARAEELGLSYDQWYGKTGDEPKESNIGGVAYAARVIKETDPRVNIYVNPAYWAGYDHGGVADDVTVARGLQGWYDEHVDLSMPLMLLVRDRPKAMEAFAAPRLVNSYYYVSGHLDRSEHAVEIQKYRRMAWNSYTLGFNGWAFYAWYSPRANPWNHHDRNPPGEGLQEPSDYQMVYPGPRGVIRTRHSEALREGWEDWRLLHLLKKQGQLELVEQLLDAYQSGDAPHDLREQALRASATTRQN